MNSRPRNARPAKPTPQQFVAYQRLYDHFNKALFGGELAPVILNFSRMAKTYGFFAPERWSSGKTVTHEISLNPTHLGDRPPRAVASTLVHEMVHAWQQQFGKPSRRGYHNAQWARKMEEVGLMPSSTAAPGGTKVGQKVSHYIIEGGPFAKAFAAIASSDLLPWKSREIESEKQKKETNRNKVKYTCPDCDSNVWGKPKLNVWCGECDSQLEEVA